MVKPMPTITVVADQVADNRDQTAQKGGANHYHRIRQPDHQHEDGGEDGVG